jgi:hypothetical protein
MTLDVSSHSPRLFLRPIRIASPRVYTYRIYIQAPFSEIVSSSVLLSALHLYVNKRARKTRHKSASLSLCRSIGISITLNPWTSIKALTLLMLKPKPPEQLSAGIGIILLLISSAVASRSSVAIC